MLCWCDDPPPPRRRAHPLFSVSKPRIYIHILGRNEHALASKQTFHAARWAEKVQEREGSSAQGIPEASHWVTRDQPDQVNRKLDEFLADM